jgi:hypothetical protein
MVGVLFTALEISDARVSILNFTKSLNLSKVEKK